ncbi:MAG: TIGR01777 family oxidoreductase [Thermostichales cyanobacterium DRC_bins_46]
MRVTVLGGSGFVGQGLIPSLLAAGHQVQVLTRDPQSAAKRLPTAVTVTGYHPLEPSTWANALAGSQGIINLTGESLAGTRWTAERKAAIQRSRITVTEALVTAIRSLEEKPEVVINSSAIGYYGPRGDEDVDETSPPGRGFLAEVCQAWEAAAQPLQELGVRLLIVRTGIVLGPGGGVLAQLTPIFQAFLGGPVGSGQQWFSWIHRQDLVNQMLFALDHREVQGVWNGTAPHPVRMVEFCQTLGQVLARPSWLPVPGLALELLFGEAAQVILTGQKVLPRRPLEAGFSFQYPELLPALQQIFLTTSASR